MVIDGNLGVTILKRLHVYSHCMSCSYQIKPNQCLIFFSHPLSSLCFQMHLPLTVWDQELCRKIASLHVDWPLLEGFTKHAYVINSPGGASHSLCPSPLLCLQTLTYTHIHIPPTHNERENLKKQTPFDSVLYSSPYVIPYVTLWIIKQMWPHYLLNVLNLIFIYCDGVKLWCYSLLLNYILCQ